MAGAARFAGRRRHYAIGGVALLLLIMGVLWQRCGVRGCPNVDRLAAYQPGGASVLLDAAGRPFADLSPIAHEIVPLDSLPPHVPAAFIAVEDRRFFQHNGVDVQRVAGAVIANVRARAFVQGFSTITMQLARNVWPDRLPGRNRTIRRKVLEIRVARDIERRFTKREILELYLNHIYFGSGAHGIEAASRNYFRKSARDLTLSEAALLAALPASPTLYNPRRFDVRAERRRRLVLTLMAQQGLAAANEAADARASAPRVHAERPRGRDDADAIAPWFAEAVRRVLEAELGEDVYASSLRVHTTMDVDAQSIAEQQLERQLRAVERGAFGEYGAVRYHADSVHVNDYVQGALVVMDARTGDVRALVGGRDYAHSRFDRATQGRRHAGSALHPFVHAAALVDGFAPSQLIADSTLQLELPDGSTWTAHDSTARGELVSLRDALVRARTLPTIRLAAEVGAGDVARVLRRAGVRSAPGTIATLGSGAVEVTPLELAAAYASLARLGSAVAPRLVTRVTDEAGEVIWEPAIVERVVMDSAPAYIVTDMLRDAVQRGDESHARHAGYRANAAAHAGVTRDGSELWFVGYTPAHIAAVWIGLDRPRPVVAEADAARIAGAVWARVMRAVDPESSQWPRPSGVVVREVDPESGALIAEGCRPRAGDARREMFVQGDEPVSVCPEGAATAQGAGALQRPRSWVGRQWRRASHWIARHFGSEERQRAPRERDYLGVPRLPRAAEVPG